MVTRGALVTAIAVTLLAGVVGLIVTYLPVSYVQVNVRWDPGFLWARQDAEQRLDLVPIREDDPSVWVYLLTDASPENVRRIFATPGVVDVRFLDRATSAPTEYQRASLGEWLDLRFDLDVRPRVRPLGLLPIFLAALVLALAARPEGRAWLVARIPPLRPSAMGVFRIVLAIALVPWVLVATTASPPALRATCFASLLAFAAGAAPRVALLVFVAAFAAVNAPDYGNHDLALPLKTLLLLCIVPWGDALSINALMRRRAVPDVPARRYGLAIWIPIVMIGLAYASAAFAKLDESGWQWLAGGAARYFLIIDGPGAPGDLWRFVARSDTLSVLASAMAIFTEAGIIVAAIWPHPAVRVTAGVAATALHAGFWAFQGIWWHGWWALLVAFLP